MLEYLKPSTLEIMYSDLQDTRSDIVNEFKADGNTKKAKEYHKITKLMHELEKQYKNLTSVEMNSH